MSYKYKDSKYSYNTCIIYDHQYKSIAETKQGGIQHIADRKFTQNDNNANATRKAEVSEIEAMVKAE